MVFFQRGASDKHLAACQPSSRQRADPGQNEQEGDGKTDWGRNLHPVINVYFLTNRASALVISSSRNLMAAALLMRTIHEIPFADMNFHLAEHGLIPIEAIEVKIAFGLFDCFLVNDKVHSAVPCKKFSQRQPGIYMR